LPYPKLENSFKLFAEKLLPVLKNDPAFEYVQERIGARRRKQVDRFERANTARPLGRAVLFASANR